MLRGDLVREIVARKERGEGVKRIARELGVDRKRVRRWLKLGSWQPRRQQPRARPIERFREFIEGRGPEVGWNGCGVAARADRPGIHRQLSAGAALSQTLPGPAQMGGAGSRHPCVRTQRSSGFHSHCLPTPSRSAKHSPGTARIHRFHARVITSATMHRHGGRTKRSTACRTSGGQSESEMRKRQLNGYRCHFCGHLGIHRPFACAAPLHMKTPETSSGPV